MKRKSFKDTKKRLFLVGLSFNHGGAGDTATYNFNRWINIYSICFQSAGVLELEFPDETVNEVFSTSGTGTASSIAVNSPTFRNIRMSSGQTIVFYNPIVTRTIRLGRNTNTGATAITVLYK